MAVPFLDHPVQLFILSLNSQISARDPGRPWTEPVYIPVFVGGKADHVHQWSAACDQTERIMVRRSKELQESLQVRTANSSVHIAVLILQHLQAIQDEEITPGTEHGCDYPGFHVGRRDLFYINPATA